MQMTRYHMVISYLIKITQICHQIAVMEEGVNDVELLNVALNGFPVMWIHSSNEFVLERTITHLLGYGMPKFRRR